MRPGRELDARIAEKVMGFAITKTVEITMGPDRGYHWDGLWIDGNKNKPVPHYSTDIAAAWEVVDNIDGEWNIKNYNSRFIEVYFYSFSGGGADAKIVRVKAEADTASHAICLAALKCVEENST